MNEVLHQPLNDPSSLPRPHRVPSAPIPTDQAFHKHQLEQSSTNPLPTHLNIKEPSPFHIVRTTHALYTNLESLLEPASQHQPSAFPQNKKDDQELRLILAEQQTCGSLEQGSLKRMLVGTNPLHGTGVGHGDQRRVGGARVAVRVSVDLS